MPRRDTPHANAALPYTLGPAQCDAELTFHVRGGESSIHLTQVLRERTTQTLTIDGLPADRLRPKLSSALLADRLRHRNERPLLVAHRRAGLTPDRSTWLHRERSAR